MHRYVDIHIHPSNTLHLPSHSAVQYKFNVLWEYSWTILLDFRLKGALSTRLITEHCDCVQQCNNQEQGRRTDATSNVIQRECRENTVLFYPLLLHSLLPRQSSMITCLALITTKRIIILLNFLKVSSFSSTTGTEREPQRAPVIPNVINGNLAPPPIM